MPVIGPSISWMVLSFARVVNLGGAESFEAVQKWRRWDRHLERKARVGRKARVQSFGALAKSNSSKIGDLWK